MKLKKNAESNYYDAGGLSVVDIWKAKLTKEELRGLFKGNVLKYLLRAGKKNKNTALKDLNKAKDYLENLIETYQEDSQNE